MLADLNYKAQPSIIQKADKKSQNARMHELCWEFPRRLINYGIMHGPFEKGLDNFLFLIILNMTIKTDLG